MALPAKTCFQFKYKSPNPSRLKFAVLTERGFSGWATQSSTLNGKANAWNTHQVVIVGGGGPVKIEFSLSSLKGRGPQSWIGEFTFTPGDCKKLPSSSANSAGLCNCSTSCAFNLTVLLILIAALAGLGVFVYGMFA